MTNYPFLMGVLCSKCNADHWVLGAHLYVSPANLGVYIWQTDGQTPGRGIYSALCICVAI